MFKVNDTAVHLSYQTGGNLSMRVLIILWFLSFAVTWMVFFYKVNSLVPVLQEWILK